MHAWGVLRTNPGDDVIRAYTATFRGAEEGAEEGAEGDGEAGLDGAQCAKLLCAYGRTRHQPPPTHAPRSPPDSSRRRRTTSSTRPPQRWVCGERLFWD